MPQTNRSTSSFGVHAIGLFFLLMLVMPTAMQTERGMFLAGLLFCSLIVVLMEIEIWRTSRQIFAWLLLICATSLLSMFNGSIRNAPGVLAVAGVFVIWPIIFTWIIGFSRKIETYITIINTLLIGVFLSSLIGILLVASVFVESLESFRPLLDYFGGRAGVGEEGIELSIPNMATVMYGFSFIMAYLYAFQKSDSDSIEAQSRSLLWVLMILCFVTLLVSGKRGFWLSAILAFPFTFVVCHMTSVRRISIRSTLSVMFPLMIAMLLGFIVIGFLLEIDYQNVIDNLITGFNFTDQTNSSAFRRYTQFLALIDGWTGSPLIGAGHGAMAGDKVGNELQPWAYELQYLALLFQTGLVGFFIYSSSVFWLLYQMIRLSKRYHDLARLMIPSAVGLLSFLTANATNPYLGKFDYLWVIFLPVGLVNIGLLRDRQVAPQCRRAGPINSGSPLSDSLAQPKP